MKNKFFFELIVILLVTICSVQAVPMLKAKMGQEGEASGSRKEKVSIEVRDRELTNSCLDKKSKEDEESSSLNPSGETLRQRLQNANLAKNLWYDVMNLDWDSSMLEQAEEYLQRAKRDIADYRNKSKYYSISAQSFNFSDQEREALGKIAITYNHAAAAAEVAITFASLRIKQLNQDQAENEKIQTQHLYDQPSSTYTETVECEERTEGDHWLCPIVSYRKFLEESVRNRYSDQLEKAKNELQKAQTAVKEANDKNKFFRHLFQQRFEGSERSLQENLRLEEYEQKAKEAYDGRRDDLVGLYQKILAALDEGKESEVQFWCMVEAKNWSFWKNPFDEEGDCTKYREEAIKAIEENGDQALIKFYVDAYVGGLSQNPAALRRATAGINFWKEIKKVEHSSRFAEYKEKAINAYDNQRDDLVGLYQKILAALDKGRGSEVQFWCMVEGKKFRFWSNPFDAGGDCAKYREEAIKAIETNGDQALIKFYVDAYVASLNCDSKALESATASINLWKEGNRFKLDCDDWINNVHGFRSTIPLSELDDLFRKVGNQYQVFLSSDLLMPLNFKEAGIMALKHARAALDELKKVVHLPSEKKRISLWRKQAHQAYSYSEFLGRPDLTSRELVDDHNANNCLKYSSQINTYLEQAAIALKDSLFSSCSANSTLDSSSALAGEPLLEQASCYQVAVDYARDAEKALLLKNEEEERRLGQAASFAEKRALILEEIIQLLKKHRSTRSGASREEVREIFGSAPSFYDKQTEYYQTVYDCLGKMIESIEPNNSEQQIEVCNRVADWGAKSLSQLKSLQNLQEIQNFKIANIKIADLREPLQNSCQKLAGLDELLLKCSISILKSYLNIPKISNSFCFRKSVDGVKAEILTLKELEGRFLEKTTRVQILNSSRNKYIAQLKSWLVESEETLRQIDPAVERLLKNLEARLNKEQAEPSRKRQRQI